MIEWVVLGVVAAGAAGAVARFVGKKKTHGGWAERLEEVAAKVGGRASPATSGDDPELRAEIDGITVTLRLVDIHAKRRGRVDAQARLPDPDNTARLYIGWDVLKTPVELEHVPEVSPDGPSRLDGHLILRAEDPTLAHRALAAARLDLADIRREASAEAVELVMRGGYLTLSVAGLEPTASLLERALRVTARLAKVVDDASKGTTLPAGAGTTADGGEAPTPKEVRPAPRPVGDTARCALCEQGARAGVAWMRCTRCAAPYHEDCWRQATVCLAEGCSGAEAEPAES